MAQYSDVIMDVVEAQREYRRHLKDESMVLMLASMLHLIAVGNMLSSTVKVICVDISPSVVFKLIGRGTAQSVGVIFDVGAFSSILARWAFKN